jgi:uncharacterized RDD family membrane protein YckC
LAVLFLATALVLPFNAGQAFSTEQTVYPLYLAYLCLISFLYFAWSWVKAGQTLGLRAWKLKLIRFDGGPVKWSHAGLRFIPLAFFWALLGVSLQLQLRWLTLFCGLCLGLNFFWSLVDKNKLTGHDYLSKTHLINLK